MNAVNAIALLMLLSASSLGCGSESDEVPGVCHNPDIGVAALGTGDKSTDFMPLERGDDLLISFNANGIYLFNVGLAVARFEPPSPDPSPSLIQVGMRGPPDAAGSLEDVGLVGGASEELYPRIRDGVSEFLGIACQVQVDDVAALFDQSVRLEAEVTDGCGRLIETSAMVRLRF